MGDEHDRAPKSWGVGDDARALISAELGLQRATVVAVKVVNKKRKFEVVLNDGSTHTVQRGLCGAGTQGVKIELIRRWPNCSLVSQGSQRPRRWRKPRN